MLLGIQHSLWVKKEMFLWVKKVVGEEDLRLLHQSSSRELVQGLICGFLLGQMPFNIIVLVNAACHSFD
jgi:hypothetical protein